MSDIPARRPLNPVKILAMSTDELLSGPPEGLQYKMYALVTGQGDIWAEGSPEYLAAETMIDLLRANFPDHHGAEY